MKITIHNKNDNTLDSKTNNNNEYSNNSNSNARRLQ